MNVSFRLYEITVEISFEISGSISSLSLFNFQGTLKRPIRERFYILTKGPVDVNTKFQEILRFLKRSRVFLQHLPFLEIEQV